MAQPLDLKQYIRNVPDFPKPGIMFRDITPLLASPVAFQHALDLIAERYADTKPTAILGAESRGFIFAAPLAVRLGASFIPIRKPGKLPWQTRRLDYDLEYGSDGLEMHIDAFQPGSRVLLVDDLLATGGTLTAAVQLLRNVGGDVVAAATIIELTFLGGRTKIDVPFETLIAYDS